MVIPKNSMDEAQVKAPAIGSLLSQPSCSLIFPFA
jgi:hypothetical protein